ncbi:MAG: hypothetical protein LH647_07615, partial [Leptolyngbyaceae cyanobacterium CAN_BIN12]|nr:hypothetical protein [Leptolyngbyaceae cyanobacterium CAN_BIN12]
MIDFDNAKANRTKTKPQGFTPAPKSDRPSTQAPSATGIPGNAASVIATDESFDLTPVIAAAAELVGQDTVDARIAEYREDELTDQEIAGYLPRWAVRKASKASALAVADKSNKTIATTQKS